MNIGSRPDPSAVATKPEAYWPGACWSHCQQPHQAQVGLAELEQLTPAEVQALQRLVQGPAPSESPPAM